MIVHDSSLMDTYSVCSLGKKLVSIKVSILLWQSHVVPCDVLCLVDITWLHIRILKSHCREVIAKHNNDGVLISLRKLICELLDEAVSLVELVYIICPGIFHALVLNTWYGVCRIFNNRLLWIVTVSANCDDISKIRLIRCSIKGLHSLTDENIICRPASVWSVLCDIHELLACKCIKAHLRKCIGTAVEITTVVVHYMCCISNLR